MELDVADQIASRFVGTPEELCRRVKAKVPSAKPSRMNRKGMNSPETRQQLQTSDIDAWSL
jgi:hypothetical protein